MAHAGRGRWQGWRRLRERGRRGRHRLCGSVTIAIGGYSVVPIEIARPTSCSGRERTRLKARGAVVGLASEDIGVDGGGFITVVGRARRASCHGESSRAPRRRRQAGRKRSITGSRCSEAKVRRQVPRGRRSRNAGNGVGAGLGVGVASCWTRRRVKIGDGRSNKAQSQSTGDGDDAYQKHKLSHERRRHMPSRSVCRRKTGWGNERSWRNSGKMGNWLFDTVVGLSRFDPQVWTTKSG